MLKPTTPSEEQTNACVSSFAMNNAAANASAITSNLKPVSGFTLVEILIALTLFILISVSIYSVSNNILGVISRNQVRSIAVSVIENEIETLRNMQYESVGIVGGFPVGMLEAEKTVTVRGIEFSLSTTVRTIDDPFDGTIGGNPNDTAPADYKLVEFEIVCLNCSTQIKPIEITTTVAPPSLETTTNNGALFVRTFDASGQPVVNADVHVENNVLNPTITINDETNVDGVLQLVDIPTSTQSYEIAVSKDGYTSEQTYTPGEPSNPSPVNSHSTVATQAITTISFQIDRVSTVNLVSSDKFCSGIQGVNFQIQGTKLIGIAPDVYRYFATSITGPEGIVSLNNVVWDTYTLTNTDGDYDIAGNNPGLSFTIDPNATVNARWLMTPKNPSALHVNVRDTFGNLIDNASVRLQGGSTNETSFTGRNSFSQTDWSGLKYSSKDAGVETDNPSGEITLVQNGGPYATNTTSSLISETFDLGTSTTEFYNLDFYPISQPAETGNDSLRIQIATNNDNSSWNFVGPDGTSESYYTTNGMQIHESHNNNRYLRYKIFLRTASEVHTPSLEDIKFGFSSSCIPDGQAFFNGLSSGTYTITVEKSGFQTFTDNLVSISGNWQEYNVTLTP